jgi:hypothetical protein
MNAVKLRFLTRCVTVLLLSGAALVSGASSSSALFRVPDNTDPYSLTCDSFRTQNQAQEVYDGQVVAQNGLIVRLSDAQVQRLDRDNDYRACEDLPVEAGYQTILVGFTLALMLGVQTYRVLPRERRGGGLQYEDSLNTTFLLTAFSWPAIFIPTIIWDYYPAREQIIYSILCGLVFGSAFGLFASSLSGRKKT